ncbi:MAG TPA: DEAD/DEAH box helicase [Ramlibacter sp.]|nr:DEAD/DEAH box helicase [Ramlibacter sp.]
MSSRGLFHDVALAPGRPYAERAEDEAGWHDRLARALHAATLAPVQRALAGFDGELKRLVAAVAACEDGLRLLPDAELRQRAAALRPRLRQQGFCVEAAAECFALVRAAAARTVGQRHFDSQLMGGYALLHGRLVEMATGEGKTFCATLPACAMALAGYPVHVITVNDYLAQRDAEKMGPLYAFFGLGVGVVIQGMAREDRRTAYAQAITYATNKELAFDYLRDRVALRASGSRLQQSLHRLAGGGQAEGTVLRGLYYAIVDEADSVFVDEARTPLILSASGGDDEAEAEHGRAALRLAATLEQGIDYQVDPRERQVTLGAAGQDKLDAFAAERDGPWTSVRGREELLRQALTALHLYRRDQQYVVLEGKVQIVDESTGRVMPDRSWERGLHQLIELKEGVPPTPRRETLARLTYQRLFRRYVRLAGMTGTAAEAAAEIGAVYGLPLARIPLHRPSRRREQGSTVCATGQERWDQVAAAAQRVAVLQGRPVLIGTRSVQASETVSALLRERGLPHALLNAKQDAHEAAVVAGAGQPGCITVATNMAGRGTDILLGPGVEARGGLHVILTEFHDSRRIDRQLVGRSARQGDPGSWEAIVSLEDAIFQLGAPRAAALLRRALALGLPLPGPLIEGLRRWAQHATERRHTAIRKANLKQDRQLLRALAFTGRGE